MFLFFEVIFYFVKHLNGNSLYLYVIYGITTMDKTIKNNGLRFGILSTTWYTLTTVLIFFWFHELFVSVYMGFANTLASLLIGTLSIVFAKKKLGGYITFKDAFTSFLIPIVLGLAMHIVVSMILFNLVDPSMKEVFKELSIAFTHKNMSGLQVAPEAIEATIEQIKTTDNFSLGNLIRAFAWKTLLYSIGGLLISLIFRNKSEFTPVATNNTEAPQK